MGKGLAGRRGTRRQGTGFGAGAGIIDGMPSITFGFEEAGIGAKIHISMEKVALTLGIGIAAVELDLIEINNSKVSYAFDTYSIEGERDGCTVVLTYKISGVTTHTEVRRIPDCDEDKEQEEKLPDEDFEEPGSGDNDSTIEIPGSPLDIGVFLVGVTQDAYVAGIAREYMNAHSQRRKKTVTEGEILEFTATRIAWKVILKEKAQNQGWYRPSSVHPEWIPVDLGEQSETSVENEMTFYQYDGYTINSTFYNSSSRGNIRNGFLYVGYAGQIQKVIKNQLPNVFSSTLIPATERYGGWNPPSPVDPLGVWFYYSFSVIDSRPIKETPTRGGINGKQSGKIQKKKNKDMDEKCCEMIRQIYDVLAVDEMIDEGFSAPNRLIAMEGKGNYLATNYLKILEFQVRIMDHLGIHPIVAELEDTNLIKAGKQGLKPKTVNAHAAIKQILENSYKNDTNNEAILRVLGATDIALSQILRAVTEGVRKLRDIMTFLGVPIKEKQFKIIMPFNVQALYKKKTTKKKQDKKTVEVTEKVLNTEEKLETLLPKFIQNSQQNFLYEGYDDDQPNLISELKEYDISDIEQFTKT